MKFFVKDVDRAGPDLSSQSAESCYFISISKWLITPNRTPALFFLGWKCVCVCDPEKSTQTQPFSTRLEAPSLTVTHHFLMVDRTIPVCFNQVKDSVSSSSSQIESNSDPLLFFEWLQESRKVLPIILAGRSPALTSLPAELQAYLTCLMKLLSHQVWHSPLSAHMLPLSACAHACRSALKCKENAAASTATWNHYSLQAACMKKYHPSRCCAKPSKRRKWSSCTHCEKNDPPPAILDRVHAGTRSGSNLFCLCKSSPESRMRQQRDWVEMTSTWRQRGKRPKIQRQ